MNSIDKIKYTIKWLAAYVLYYSGLMSLIQRNRLKNKAIVLMYHRILSTREKKRTFSQDGIIVDTITFEKQVRFLKKKFNVISIDEFNTHLSNREPFDNYTCLITFDDGWKDNYTNAYPILKKYKIPAVIFLPTNYIGTGKKFWQENLTEMLITVHFKAKQNQHLISKLEPSLEKYHLDHILSQSEHELRSSISEIIKQLKRHTWADIQDLISELSTALELHTEENNNFLDWSEIRQMAMDGVSFGSHGINHLILNNLDQREAKEEITKSKQLIEENLNNDVSSFSYPNGDYNKTIVHLVKNNDYRTAFTTKSGWVDIHDDPYVLDRINIHNDVTRNIPMFMTRILGIF